MFLVGRTRSSACIFGPGCRPEVGSALRTAGSQPCTPPSARAAPASSRMRSPAGEMGRRGPDGNPGLPGLLLRAGGPCRGRWRSGSPGPGAAPADRAGQALPAAGQPLYVRASAALGLRVSLLTPPPAASRLPTLSTNHELAGLQSLQSVTSNAGLFPRKCETGQPTLCSSVTEEVVLYKIIDSV